MNKKQSEILEEIKHNIESRIYFFDKLATEDNSYKLFNALAGENFFGNAYLSDNSIHSILKYLKSISTKIYILKLKGIEKKLFSILTNLINSSSQNVNIDYYLIEILFEFKASKFKKLHWDYIVKQLKVNDSFSFVDYHIEEKLIPNLISEQNISGLKKLLGILLLSVPPPKSEQYVLTEKTTSLIDRHTLLNIFSKFYNEFYEILGDYLIEEIYLKIKTVSKSDKYIFSVTSIPSIEVTNQRWNFADYGELVLDFLRNIILLSDKKTDFDFVSKLLKNPEHILKRLGLYLIGLNYNRLNKLFWEKYKYYLESYECHHETFILLKNNALKFDEKNIELLITYIGSINYKYENKTENELKVINACNKKRWLMSLESIKNTEIEHYYNELSKICSYKLEHPEFLNYHGNVTSMELHSETKDSFFENKTRQQIVNDLKLISSNEINPRLDNFPYSFQKYFYDNYETLIKHILDYKDLNVGLQIPIFKVATEKYENNPNQYFNKYISYLEVILSEEQFWKKAYKDYDYNKRWFLTDICEYIYSRARNDDKPFEKLIFNKIKNVLKLLLNNYIPELANIGDVRSEVLNSYGGKLYEAVICYSLQSKRLFQNSKFSHFKKHFEDYFKNKKLINIELYAIIGQYFAYLRYHLDKRWSDKNTKYLFNKENMELVNWESNLSYFFFHNVRINTRIFKLLKLNNVFNNGINYDFKNMEIDKSISEYIFYTYLYKYTQYSGNSLLRKLINKGNENKINSIIHLIYNVKKDGIKFLGMIEINSTNIIKIVYSIYNRYKNKSDEASQKVLSNLCLTIIIFNETDKLSSKEFELYKDLVTYIHKSYRSPQFVEHSVKLSKLNPEEIGILLYKVIQTVYEKSKILLHNHKDNISSILTNLFESNNKEAIKQANMIINFYQRKNNYKFDNIYRKYNDIQ